MAKEITPFGTRQRRHHEHGRLLVAQSVAGGGVFQLGDGDDFAGDRAGDGRLLLALEAQQLAEALLRFARRVEDTGIGLSAARNDAEDGELAGEWIDNRLEHQRGERRRRIRRTADRLAAVGILAFNRRALVGRGQIGRDGVEQRRDTDILRARAAEHRRDLALDDGRMQRRANFGVVERALVEIFFEQRVVGLRDRFEQCGARRFRLGLELGGQFLFLEFAAGVGVGQRLHREHVDHALEAELLANRDRQRDGARAEHLLEILERGVEAGAFAIEPRHECDPRQLEVFGRGPDFFGFDLGVCARAYQHHDAVHRAQSRERLGQEGGVAGRVGENYFGLFPVEMIERGADRNVMLGFFGLEVHRGRAVVRPSQPRRRARREEHRVGGLRLAGPALAHDCDSSKPSDFLHSHGVHLSQLARPGPAPISERRAPIDAVILRCSHKLYSYAPSTLTSPATIRSTRSPMSSSRAPVPSIPFTTPV